MTGFLVHERAARTMGSAMRSSSIGSCHRRALVGATKELHLMPSGER